MSTDGATGDHDDESLRVVVSPAQASWLNRFWAPTQVRRQNGAVSISVVETNIVEVLALVALEDGTRTEWREKWTKQIGDALHKLCEEDLGKMDAPDLLQAIHETVNTNTGNTGIADLTALENKLNVLVYFDCIEGPDQGHVKLLGAKKKLDKKCADLRTILSHYHWRLSGKDVAFETMVAK